MSEELLGRFIEEAGARDRVVLATKYTMSASPGDPNAGGNGRKNLISSLERSLRRLRTDYVDLYWLHCWDQMTPVEEVMSTLDALVRSGKVRAIGLSNVPAWYAATAQLTARANGWEPIAALQLQYSLVQRSIEAEFVPAVSELGMAIVGYSPLANGFLTGKYSRGTQGVIGTGRIAEFRGSGHAPTYSDRDWRILDELKVIATETDSTPGRVALAWVARRPGVGSTLIGARKPEQLIESLGALELRLTRDQLQRLDRVSAPESGYPYDFFNGELRNAVMYGGESRVQREPSWFRSA